MAASPCRDNGSDGVEAWSVVPRQVADGEPAAGIIMGAVFAGFIFSGDTVVKSMGLALAVGVLLDAFVVRTTLVPAVMSLLGDKAWWLPRWLARALPDVDVEGEKLAQVLANKAVQAADRGHRAELNGGPA